MKKLIDYDVLVNDVFYRSEHILDYIIRHKNISELDQKAISNTILDALVDCKVMDSTKQSLDLEEMAIVDDLDHITYDYHPTVTSIPLSIKEKMRQKCLKITGGLPISCFYNSPTRKGVKTEVRPFLKISYHDEEYYVDALTKRMFKRDWFDKTYNLKEKERISKTNFSSFQQIFYDEQTSSSDDYYILIDFFEPLTDSLIGTFKYEEFIYEFDKSKEYFPKQFEKANRSREKSERRIYEYVRRTE